jgi:protein-S-isoprenylcysteine O-methyltransferase Ste14
MIWARLTFGRRSFHASAGPTEGGLVTTGPYRYWRHPIYAAILVFLWAGVASHFSLLNVCIALIASLGTGVRIAAEERLVRERYPEYAAYAARTKRLLPFVF